VLRVSSHVVFPGVIPHQHGKLQPPLFLKRPSNISVALSGLRVGTIVHVGVIVGCGELILVGEDVDMGVDEGEGIVDAGELDGETADSEMIRVSVIIGESSFF
jgi:hypothetical protein